MNYHGIQLRLKENRKDYSEFLCSETKAKTTPIAKVAPEMKQNADVDTEITKTCAVLGCEDSKNLGNESYFKFPEEPSLRQIWADLTGRNNWTPTDYSYICIQHFSVDCFFIDDNNIMVLAEKSVPSLKLPRHVLEVEYIEEESDEEGDSDMEYEEEKPTVNGNSYKNIPKQPTPIDKIQLLKLFSEVQTLQRQMVNLRDKVKTSMRMHNKQNKFLNRLQQVIELKRKILNQKRKKKSRILLTLQDKVKEDTNGLVLAMPIRHTEDLKNFALSIYKYSPPAYIYIRNTLRTMLPSTAVLDSWLNSGFQPKSVISNSNVIKITSEQTESALSCQIKLT